MRKLSTLILVILAGALVAPCSRAQNLSVGEMKELAAEKEAKQDELVNLEKDMARAMQATSWEYCRRDRFWTRWGGSRQSRIPARSSVRLLRQIYACACLRRRL